MLREDAEVGYLENALKEAASPAERVRRIDVYFSIRLALVSIDRNDRSESSDPKLTHIIVSQPFQMRGYACQESHSVYLAVAGIRIGKRLNNSYFFCFDSSTAFQIT